MKTQILIFVATFAMMIVMYLFKKDSFNVFREFPFGTLLKKEGPKTKRGFLILFLLSLFFFLSATIQFPEKFKFITIIPALYLAYYWKIFDDEYSVRTTLYDEYGNYLINSSSKFPMPMANESFGKIIPIKSPREKMIDVLKERIKKAKAKRIAVYLGEKQDKKFFIFIKENGYSIYEKKASKKNGKKLFKIKLEDLAEKIKKNIPQTGEEFMVKYIL